MAQPGYTFSNGSQPTINHYPTNDPSPPYTNVQKTTMAQPGYTFSNGSQPTINHYPTNDPPPPYTNVQTAAVIQQPQTVIVQRPTTNRSTGKTLAILALIITCVSLVLCIIGTAIPFWIYASVGGTVQSEGLWQLCVTRTIYDTSTCVTFIEETVRSWVKAVRTLEILGILLIAASGISGLLKLFAAKDQKVLQKLAACSGVLAGMLILIGVIVYATKFLESVPVGTPYRLFAGFGLCLVAGILAILAGIVYALAHYKQQV